MTRRTLALVLAAALAACFFSCAKAQEFSDYDTKCVREKTICAGVEFAEYALSPLDGPAGRAQRVFVLDVNPALNPSLGLTAAVEGGFVRGSRMRVTALAAQEKAATGANVVAAVNGDFFDTASGGPMGYMMRDGEWIVLGEFYDGWAVGMTSDGRAIVGQPKASLSLSAMRGEERLLKNVEIDALNASRADVPSSKAAPSNVLTARGDNELVLYTTAYAKKTYAQDGGVEVLIKTDQALKSGGVVSGVVERINGEDVSTKKGTLKIPQGMVIEQGTMVLSGVGEGASLLKALEIGDRVEITCAADEAFAQAVTVVGGGRPDGGPLLVFEGMKAQIDMSLADDASYFYPRNPRTAFGLRADGTWFLMVIEGNRSGSYGMTTEQESRAALDLGAWMAVNLDGGPSSAMAVRLKTSLSLVTNTTGTGSETPVGSGLLLTNGQ